MRLFSSLALAALLIATFTIPAHAANKPIKTFTLAGGIEKHPRNVHYNTAGQLVVGKLFAEAFLAEFGE